MSDNDNCNSKTQVKKRTRNPAEWKREKRKRLRIAGKAYVNSKGDVVKERKIGEDCRCRRKCYNRVPEDQRNKLFDGYYALNSHDEQNAYLFGLIRKHDIARKRCKESDRRTCSYKYYARIRGKEVQICRLAFAHIHGISPHKIRILCQKQDQNIMFPRDGRGKHNNRPRKIPNDVLCQIKEHIYSIIKSDKVRDFLKEEKHNGPCVNITKMWKDYLAKYDPCYKEIFNGSDDMETAKDDVETSLEPDDALLTDFPEAVLSDNQQTSFSSTVDLSDYPITEDSFGLLNTCTETEGNSSETEDNPDLPDNGNTKPSPTVKHWLYSKIFHEEFKVSDKKKLSHIKETKPAANQQGNKSERKQRMPKKISRDKELSSAINLSEPVLAVNSVQPITETGTVAEFGASTDMYILPISLQDLSQLPQSMEVATQSQPAMQFNLHTFSAQNNVLSPLVNVAAPAQLCSGTQGMQCSSVVSLPAATVSFTQNSCAYMNLNMTAFY